MRGFIYFLIIFLPIIGCNYQEETITEIPLSWEYALSRKEDSIYQSLEKDFKPLSKEGSSFFPKLNPQRKGYVWFKAKFILPREINVLNNSILLSKIQWERDIYINGNLISSTIDYENSHWNYRGITDIFLLPKAYLKTELENTLLLKLYYEDEYTLPEEIKIGTEKSIFPLYNLFKIKEFYLNIFLETLALFFAIVHLGLYLTGKKDIEQKYLALALVFFFLTSIYNISNFFKIYNISPNYGIISKLEFLFYFFSYFYLYKLISKKSKIAKNEIEYYIIEIYTISSSILYLFSGNSGEYFIPSSIKYFLHIPILIVIFIKISSGTSKKIPICQVLYPLGLLLFFNISYDFFNLFIKFNDKQTQFYTWFGIIIASSIFKISENFLNLDRTENKLNYIELLLNDKYNIINESQSEIEKLSSFINSEYYIVSLLSEPLFTNKYKEVNFRVNTFTEQKNSFSFKNKHISIGGDLCIVTDLKFNGYSNDFIFYCNIDATGKSLKGAVGLIGAGIYFKHILRGEINQHPKIFLEDTLNNLNTLFRTFNGNMYLSASSGIINQNSGELFYSLQGHPKNILYRDSRTEYLPEFQPHLLGSEELDSINIYNFQLKVDDILFISSDGRESLVLGGIYGGVKTETEKLFIKIIEKSNGIFQLILDELKNYGSFSDDFSMIQIECINIHDDNPNIFRDQIFDKRIKADNYYQIKNYEHAIILYLDLLKDSMDFDLYFKLAMSYKYIKDFQNASKFFKIAFEKDKNNIAAFLHLCDTYRLNGEKDKAKELFLNSDDYFPQIKQILRLRAIIESN